MPAAENCLQMNENMAKLLLEYDTDVNGRDEEGKTALMIAAEDYSLDFMRLLLEKNADINATTIYNDSALSIALKNNRKNVSQFLIDMGADVNSPSSRFLQEFNPYPAFPSLLVWALDTAIKQR